MYGILLKNLMTEFIKTYPLFSELHKMTITERNQKLYDLRKKLDQKRMELAWIETEIMAVNSEYDRQNVDLYEEMFGEKNTLWDHLDRMSDTPMAEEVYGG